MVKTFVLDTNILLSAPTALTEGFDDNTVIICGTVLQELDKKKSLGGETGYNAREACRILDDLRKKGDLIKGVPLENGGVLKIEPDGVMSSYLPLGYSIDVPDNRIISSTIHIARKEWDVDKDRQVVLVTNDISMRINATACFTKYCEDLVQKDHVIDVQAYKNIIVNDSGYTGYMDAEIPYEDIQKLFKEGEVVYANEELPYEALKGKQVYDNTFITAHCGDQSVLCVRDRLGSFKRIPDMTLFGDTKGKNSLQKYFMWAATRPAAELPLVISSGPAGCGKTFLALAAGLSCVYTHQKKKEREYDKIIIARPNIENDDGSFGYLPGDLSEKSMYLMGSYYDNLTALFRNDGDTPEEINQQIDYLFNEGIIEIVPLNYIRGRSFMNTYIIVDEMQNCSRHLVRDICSRIGEGSKLIALGDPSQIDKTTLDSHTCGLSYLAETMKDSSYSAYIKFTNENSVRSALAKEIISKMVLR